MLKHKNQYENRIDRLKSNPSNIAFRTIAFVDGTATLFYIKQLTDRVSLSENVVKPLILHSKEETPSANTAIERILYTDNCEIANNEDTIVDYILNGQTVLLLSSDDAFVVIDLKKVQQREVPSPELSYTLRGPRDCFNENLDTNLSLLQYRLKDQNLALDMKEVGQRTKTKIVVAYIRDIANDNMIQEIHKRIDAIEIDGIVESGELQDFLLNNKLNLFPQTGILERSDIACGALLEGKAVILIDGSALGIIIPKVFSEFLWPSDDIYENKYVALFLRMLVTVALFMSFCVSALYVGIVSYHNDVFPGSYLIALAKTRMQVPFIAMIEVLLIEFIAELLRDALVRITAKIGPAIGIVGAIIIGQSAIAAGVFSPLLLIVVSISLISSFVPADYTLVNTFRVIKFILIFATGFFGFYGFTLAFTVLLINLVSINSFGVPYLAPAAPFNLKDFFKAYFYSKSLAPRRPSFLRPKDPTRAPPHNPMKNLKAKQKASK